MDSLKASNMCRVRFLSLKTRSRVNEYAMGATSMRWSAIISFGLQKRLVCFRSHAVSSDMQEQF